MTKQTEKISENVSEIVSRRSPTVRGIIQYVAPLIGFALAVFAAWLYHWQAGFASPRETRTLFSFVGFVLYIAAASMLIFERRWQLQSLGLLGIMIACGELMVRFLARRGPQPVAEWERDLIQALFDVSALVIIISVVVFGMQDVVNRRRRTPNDSESEQ